VILWLYTLTSKRLAIVKDVVELYPMPYVVRRMLGIIKETNFVALGETRIDELRWRSAWCLLG
jgi:hypothetical protein